MDKLVEELQTYIKAEVKETVRSHMMEHKPSIPDKREYVDIKAVANHFHVSYQVLESHDISFQLIFHSFIVPSIPTIS